VRIHLVLFDMVNRDFDEGFLRLGPLQVEQKKRVMKQRAKLEKNKADEVKPQEIHEEDIQRSENETTKNVIKVSPLVLIISIYLGFFYIRRD
jgi:hypothetical protein